MLERPAVLRSKAIKLQQYLATVGVNGIRYGGADGFAKCWDDNPDWASRQAALGRSQTWMTEWLPDTYQPIPSDFDLETKRLDVLRFVDPGPADTWSVPCVAEYGCLMPFSQLMADFDPTRFRFPTEEAVQGLAAFCVDVLQSFTGDPLHESTVTEEELEEGEEEEEDEEADSI